MNSNDIYTTLLSKCSDHHRNLHYLQRYVKFVYACIDKNATIPLCFTIHKHHILPKATSLWPEYKSFIKHSWNMAGLTTKQHTIAHWMLARALGGGMWLAYNYLKKKPNLDHLTSVDIEAMVNVGIVQTGHTVSEQTRAKISEGVKRNHINKSPEERLAYNLAHVGKTQSDEAKQKVRDFQLGRSKSDETKRKLSEAHTGKTFSDETKSKMQGSATGRVWPKVTCPHCGKVGAGGVMKQKHFDNCLLDPVSQGRNRTPRKPHSDETKQKIRESTLARMLQP